MADEREYRQGRRLLRELLPWAKAESRKAEVETEIGSALGRSVVTYLTEDNLDALLIYPAPKGGWHADVVLKSVPPGVPNVFGTPVENPCRTRAEAEERGKDLLVSLLQLAAKNVGAEPAAPVFMLHDWTFPLKTDVLPQALTLMPEFASGYGSPLQASARVEAALDELCPEGFDGKAFDAWPHDKKARLWAVLHIAALSGLFVYPMRRDAAPKSEANGDG
jgi:hypothetical protein